MTIIDYRPALGGLLPFVHAGKVRETYQLPGHLGLLLLYATDRVSTHNVVHLSSIPDKGIVLTALTVYWLREVFPDLPHHLVASGREIYQYLPEGVHEKYPDLHHRALIVRKLDMSKSKVELIYRRHLVEAGSLYKAYVAGKDPYGLQLPAGLPIMHRFDPPIFTPTDKSETDEPLDFRGVQQLFPSEVKVTATAFLRGEEHLMEHGIGVLDCKFEASGGVLADEILTSDSSRFASLEEIEKAVREGRDPPWMDKQGVRDEAERIWNGGQKMPLQFSNKVVLETKSLLDYVLCRISGHGIQRWINSNRFDHHIAA